MKKITLALCACAFALTGLLASCSSEAPTSVNYTDRSEYESTYKYAVKGTLSSTSEKSTKNGAGKVTTDHKTSDVVISNGNVEVSWSTDENEVSNAKYFIINGTGFGTATSEEYSVFDGSQDGNKNTNVTAEENPIQYTIAIIEDEYYFAENGEFIKLDTFAIDDEDVLDGDFGDEFTLTFKKTADNTTFEKWYEANYGGELNYAKKLDKDNCLEYAEWETWKKDVSVKDVETETVKLTFYPLQDFDPEAEIEEDEE